MFTTYTIFCLIAMAFVSNPSSSEDNQSSSGTDLSIINTEDEKHIDMTNWTPATWKKFQDMSKFHEEYQQIFWRKSFNSYYHEKKDFTYESPYV